MIEEVQGEEMNVTVLRRVDGVIVMVTVMSVTVLHQVLGGGRSWWRTVHRHGHHCHSSPLAEVRIPRRAAARAHFIVINKGAGQFYLSFDTR